MRKTDPARWVPAILLCLAWRLSGASPHCGTAAWLRDQGKREASAPGLAAKRGALAAGSYRTLETPHFRVDYSLAGLNRIKTVEADSVLLRMADSLYRVSPGRGAGTGDDAFVVSRLDSLAAPHPRYAQVMAGWFEQARAYYLDTLGMRAPLPTGPSRYYRAPSGGKYAVDIADIGTADPDYRGLAYYAFTFPPSRGGMLMDNDFLYNERQGSAGGPLQGDPITSRYRGKLIHDYSVDWQAGLKVTCFHEFYHAVEYAYVPDPGLDPHIWFEAAAVAMEERNAPEVDDYLQYLPAYFARLPQAGMLAETDPDYRYGNGIFLRFLASRLGEGFDTGIWSRLAANGDDLREALSRIGEGKGTSLSRLYAGFAAQLAFSGRPILPPFAPFSPDMPLWPALPAFDIAGTLRTPEQGPLTIAAWTVTGAGGGGKSLLAGDTGLIPVAAFYGPDSARGAISDGPILPLDFPDVPGRQNLVLLANGSVDRAADARIFASRSVDAGALFAYPNPVRRADGQVILYFSRAGRSASIRIYGEAGRAVRSLEFAPDSALWSWDLRDGQGRPAAPGLYYFRDGGGPLSPILLH